MKKTGPADKIKLGDEYDKEITLARRNSYGKGGSQEFIDVSKKGSRTKDDVKTDYELFKKHVGDSKYIRLHTHTQGNVLPSRVDFDSFLSSDPEFSDDANTDKYKTMAIAETNSKTGEVRGYLVIRKSKKTPGLINSIKKSNPNRSVQSELLDRFDKIYGYNEHISAQSNEELASRINRALDYLSKEYGIKYRFVPAKGYKISKDKSHFVKIDSGIESKLTGFSAITLFTISLILLIPKLNGFIIFDNFYNLNYPSLIFFIIGLLLSIIYFKKFYSRQTR